MNRTDCPSGWLEDADSKRHLVETCLCHKLRMAQAIACWIKTGEMLALVLALSITESTAASEMLAPVLA